MPYHIISYTTNTTITGKGYALIFPNNFTTQVRSTDYNMTNIYSLNITIDSIPVFTINTGAVNIENWLRIDPIKDGQGSITGYGSSNYSYGGIGQIKLPFNQSFKCTGHFQKILIYLEEE